MEKCWYSPGELAERLNVSKATVLRRLHSGEIRGKKSGSIWRVHISAINAYEADGIVENNEPDSTTRTRLVEYI